MRKAARILLGALAATALAGGACQAAERERRDEDVLVTAVTADPRAESGVIAFAVGVSGRIGDGERSYFIPFMRAGQARPKVGERCSITWRRWRSRRWTWLLGDGTQIREGREVTGFRCRAGFQGGRCSAGSVEAGWTRADWTSGRLRAGGRRPRISESG